MGVQHHIYHKRATTRGSDRRFFSAGLWHNCPMFKPNMGMQHGFRYTEDFHKFGAAIATNDFSWIGKHGFGYDGYGTTGVTMAAGTDRTGTGVITTDANNEEASLSFGATYNVGIFAPLASGLRAWYETRVKVNNVAGANGMNKLFGVGDLGAAQTGLLTDSDCIATSFLGFHCPEADGSSMDVIGIDAGTLTVLKADALDLTDLSGDWIDLGLYAGPEGVSFFANGKPVLENVAIDATGIPTDVNMGPIWAILCGSAGTGVLTIDGWRAAGEYSEL